MSNVKHTTDLTFTEDVVNSDQPVLVDFYADWCAPCVALSPVVEEIANENADTLRVVKIDVDENPEVATKLDIRSLPTLAVFKDGGAVERWSGITPKDEILARIQNHATVTN